jgi:hypothetical protein
MIQRNVPLARGTGLARTPFPPRSSEMARTPWPRTVPALPERAATRRSGSATGRPHGFPPAVAAQLDARDPWCVYCGSPRDLQRHHRRLKGIGGDGRDHTQCACNGVRLCADHHAWAHSGAGQSEARDEGLIIPRATVEPFTVDVLVHLEGDRGGMRKWPSCDGRWLDYVQGRVAS